MCCLATEKLAVETWLSPSHFRHKHVGLRVSFKVWSGCPIPPLWQGAGRTANYPKSKTQCLWEDVEGKSFPTDITTVYHAIWKSPGGKKKPHTQSWVTQPWRESTAGHFTCQPQLPQLVSAGCCEHKNWCRCLYLPLFVLSFGHLVRGDSILSSTLLIGYSSWSP